MARNSADILKEYLVSIGFSVDEASHKKLKDQLDDLRKKQLEELRRKLVEVAAVAVGAGTALVVGITKIASSMEDLYLASQRTNTSVSALGAFRFAAQQVGISADQAQGALEGMQQALRMNPGLIGMLQSLGVNPNQAGLKVMLDLVNRLSRMPFYQGSQIAQLFGISPEILYQLEKNPEAFSKAFKQYGEIWKQSGVNPEEAAEKSRQLMLELRSLQVRFEALSITVAERFMPTLEKLFTLIEKVVDWILAADRATEGWSSILLGLGSAIGTAVGALGVLKLALGAVGLSSAESAAGVGVLSKSLIGFIGAAGSALAIGLEVKALLDSIAQRTNAEASERLTGIGSTNQGLMAAYKKALGSSVNFSDPNWWNSLTAEQRTLATQVRNDFMRKNVPLSAQGQFGAAYQGVTLRPGQTNRSAAFHNPGNLRAWGGAPLAERFRNGVSIGKFAQFGSDAEGLSAMAGQLLRYFHRGLDSISKIISTYAPAGENDTGKYIADVVKRMGLSGPGSMLNLEDPRTLQSLMAAMIHHEQGRDLYNPDTIASAVAARLAQEGGGAKPNVTQNNETHITVTGSSDPQKASDLVAAHQANVAQSQQRNLQGVMQ